MHRITLLAAVMVIGAAVSGCASDDSEDPCVALQAGHFDVTGSAFGMAMDANVAVDSTGCTLTFSDWNMAMDTPAGGTVASSAITLNGNAGSRDWALCTGTVTSATAASGTCSSDGAAWDITRTGNTT